MIRDSDTKPELTTFNDETKIWQGRTCKPIFGPQDSIGSVAIASLLKDPDHIAQICFPSGKEYTNQEIATISIRVALNLEKLCTAQGSIIGLCAGNSDFVAPLTFGALLCGLTISTLDPSFDKAGIVHVFSLTRPKLMFCDGDIYDKVKDALAEINLSSTVIYTLNNHINDVPTIAELMKRSQGEDEFKAKALQDGWNQVAMILCSSGTTGLPKGVAMSHTSLLNVKKLDMLPTDKLLSFSTLYWLSGVITLIHGTLNGSTRIISNRCFAPNDFFDMVEQYRVSGIIGPPSQMAMAMASDRIHYCDLSSIVNYNVGGSSVSFNLVKKFKQYARNAIVFVGYGMSEVCNIVSYYEMDARDSVGQLCENIEVKIVNDSGENVGQNEVGEICVRTPYPWSGYYNNPEATKETYDKDRWIHSGDMGYFDKEGFLYIVDRKKDILKYNNFHYYPTEIERVIMELPGVVEVCAVGIPDIVFTHLPAAAVVKDSQSNLTEARICEHVANKMQHFERLRGGVYFFDSLPHTASGKVLRRQVAEICKNIHKEAGSV